MAQIITLNDSRNYPDKVLALGEKELLQYSIGNQEWNELHVTLAHDLIWADGLPVRGAGYDETLVDSAVNRFQVGLKSPAEDFASDSYAISVINTNSVARYGFSPFQARPANKSIRTVGPVVQNSSINLSNLHTHICSDVHQTHGSIFLFSVVSRGTASQKIKIAVNSPYAASMVYEGDLVTKNSLATYKANNHSVHASNNALELPWLLTNGDPAPIPNTFYIYWPFSKTRLCICGILIEKIS